MNNWNKANGEPCPTCYTHVLRLYGPLKQCKKCFVKEKGMALEKINCPKCNIVAVLVTTLLQGAATTKIICRRCGTFSK